MIESEQCEVLRPRETSIEMLQKVLVTGLRRVVKASKNELLNPPQKEDLAQWSATLILDIFQLEADSIAVREGKESQKITHIKCDDLFIPVNNKEVPKHVVFDVSSK